MLTAMPPHTNPVFVTYFCAFFIASAFASLERCPDAIPDGGNDQIIIEPVGNNCANMQYSSDLRVIGGSYLSYSTSVEDSSTCASSYEQSVNFLVVNTGDGSSCKSYLIGDGIACLSSCDDLFDCYVSETEQSLDYTSCAEALGIAEETTESSSTAESEEDDGIISCYDFTNSGPGFCEFEPELRKCLTPESTCYSLESKNEDLGTTISMGGCNTIPNVCDTRVGEGTSQCEECSSELCNPVISYGKLCSSATSKSFEMKIGFVIVSLLVLAM